MEVMQSFYNGVFFSPNSPVYTFSFDTIAGNCFAPLGQPSNYRGFLFNEAVLREDFILYA